MKRKLRPSDKMEMEVMNALSSVLSDIRDDAVSVCHTERLCDLGNLLEHCGNVRRI